MTLSLISPSDFHQLSQNQQTVLLDVRTPVEYSQVHAQQAVLEPLDQLDPQKTAAKHGLTKQDNVYVICKSGGRAKTAGQKFIAAGFQNVISVEGGTDAWVAANLPVVRSASKTLPLQQQVFIVVSMMILSGVILGHFVHPAWLLLAGFAGCGLLLAGLTGFCGMALILAKMPWNQVKFKDQTVTSCAIDPGKGGKSCGCER
ncbi:MAG: rhodanese-like domain-containing protein [Phycisphaeraceae bacterium JB051]